MAEALTTSTTELGDSRVRVDVEVGPEAVEREVEGAARKLGRDLKVPGFRKGKVPPQVVLQRVGREAVLEEALRGALPTWYADALHGTGIATVGEPTLDVQERPEKGSPLAFSIEVGVRPPAKLGPYKGLEVPRREPEVEAEEIERELDRLRESVASLENVDRPAETGDYVVLDFVGKLDDAAFEGGSARGYVLELGSGKLPEDFEAGLVGAIAGEERDIRVSFPEDHHNPRLAGHDAVFQTEVKEVKVKHLPEVDDDFAASAGGFDTLAELREEVEAGLVEAQERTIEGEFRDAAVDAAVARAEVDISDELVSAKAEEVWRDTAHRLQHQGVDPHRYLEMTGKTEEDTLEELRPEAERALARESVLAAIVEAEQIEVSDDEVLEVLRRATKPSEGQEPTDEELRHSLDHAREEGRDQALREDIAIRKAVDLITEEAKPIAPEQAEAREKLWTPEKEAPAESERLWTPGS